MARKPRTNDDNQRSARRDGAFAFPPQRVKKPNPDLLFIILPTMSSSPG
jgi:hypothetical protein